LQIIYYFFTKKEINFSFATQIKNIKPMQSAHFFKIAQSHFNEALPFVLYTKPNVSIIKGMFQNDATLYRSENLTESGFVFAPFNADGNTILMPTIHSEILECAVSKDLTPPDCLQDKDFQNNFHGNFAEAKSIHLNLVSKAIKAIKKGLFKKVVLSRKEEIMLLNTNPITLFKRLLSEYKTAFVYCWYHPKIGLWLGASPETLLSVTGTRFTTMALAGTQTFMADKEPIWKAKETTEQQLVTDYLAKNLQPLVSNLTIAGVETIKAGNLLHLRTKISGILKANLIAIVAVLHPTPAVCGLPKLMAKQFILENENYHREFYTGFLGEINRVEFIERNTNRRNVEHSAYNSQTTVSNLFVNLRCMQLTDVQASVYVGGGITIDSIPEQEWEETVNKTQTIKKVLF